MVRGIEKFRAEFKDYTGQYVFIGGTACDIILSQEGINFRQTKDLDMVLIIEALNNDFVDKFVAFIAAGGYTHINKGKGLNQFYRFEKPANMEYPYMIELFSRKPDYLQSLDRRLAPIHISDDVMSLSAILLDEAYYRILLDGRIEIEGVSVLNLESLILFKMKAWLELNDRRSQGEQIDSKNIKKHKNDVLRLAASLKPGQRMGLAGQVRDDAERFIKGIAAEVINMKDIGIKGISYDEMIEKLRSFYLEVEP